MLELIIIPALVGLGLGLEYFSSEDDEDDTTNDDPIQITLEDSVIAFEGTEAKEHVQGNALDNIMRSSENNDLLSGHDGNDTLDTGAGDDRIFGGAGDDVAIGGAGDDRIFLSDGDDVTAPEAGSGGDAGDDLIRGGAGNDQIVDTLGANQIFGDLGHDEIVTVDGLSAEGTVDNTVTNAPDTVYGGFGNDTIVADQGDILTGGEGEDTFVVATLSGVEGAPAVLLDFDLREDLFSVVFLGEAPEDTSVEFVHDPDTEQLRAFVGGQEVAVLNDMEAADIPFIQTFVTSLPDLLDPQA